MFIARNRIHSTPIRYGIRRPFFSLTSDVQKYHIQKVLKWVRDEIIYTRQMLTWKFSHSPELLYQVISDVDSYSSFLPYCLESSIVDRDQPAVRAVLTIGWQQFVESFESQLTLNEKDLIVKVSCPWNNLQIIHGLKYIYIYEKS